MDKKAKILEAALDLFVQNGIDNTSTAKIARHAGVASGLIFHHFKNKEHLVKELYLYVKQSVSGNISSLIDLSSFSEEKFKALWIGGIEKGMQNTLQVRFLHQFNYSRFISLNDRDDGKSLFAEQRSFFQDGVDKGILKSIDLDILSEMVFEQSLFVIMYMDDHQVPHSEVNTFYQMARDMIFR